MKLKLSVFFILLVFLFISCENSPSSSNNDLLLALINNQANKNSSVTWTHTSDDIAGKEVYLVKINPTNASVKEEQFCVINAENMDLNTSTSSRSELPEYETSDLSEQSSTKTDPIRKIDEKYINLLSKTKLETASSRSGTSVEEAYEVDDTRDLYILTDISSSTLESKTATLYAKTDDVYVWVVEEDKTPYISKDGSKGEITKEIAERYAAKMQEIYKYICHVEVPLPENILYFTSSEKYEVRDMEEYSKTGTKINIVIADINEDNSESSLSEGTIGLTVLKDLASGTSEAVNYYDIKSNIGNYFYMDSYFCLADENDCFSTLSHEFQHLLFNGYKIIDCELLTNMTNSWLTEMLSMLTEDMMADYLNTDNNNHPLYLLPYYNSYYYFSALNQWNNSNALDYSSTYAFGAWLVRNYGGVELIHQMSTNSYVEMECVLEALKSTTKTSWTISNLQKKYSEALIYQDTSLGYTSFNKSPETTLIYNGYEYPLKSIDLWNLDDILTKKDYTSFKYDGPYYLYANSYCQLQPLGLSIHYLGTVDSSANSISLDFRSASGSGISGVINPSTPDDSCVNYYVMFK
ncbi:MAG: hypothetical protein K6F15_05290 [Treponema sp.]|nr:hypothetical protein [Treponema sp.]